MTSGFDGIVIGGRHTASEVKERVGRTAAARDRVVGRIGVEDVLDQILSQLCGAISRETYRGNMTSGFDGIVIRAAIPPRTVEVELAAEQSSARRPVIAWRRIGVEEDVLGRSSPACVSGNDVRTVSRETCRVT